jgi:polyisoprenoid-binding protein YceI
MPDYAIDPVVSRFTIRGFASGMLSALGHNPVVGIRDISGEARFDPESPGKASLRVHIPAASLQIQNNASEKDRREMKRVMDEEVLEAARYPEIAFESTGVKMNGNGGSAEIEGRLTLHGVTRPFRLPARIFVMGDLLRANGEFTILQSDYRIKPVSVAGGTLKLKDELKLAFDIAARLKSENATAAGQGESHVPGNSR